MNLDTGTKLNFLREMLRIRLFEEKICELYPEQEMRCPVHLSIGQEATAVGMCSALYSTDIVFGNHRSHGHYIAKGGNLGALLAEIYGKSTGCCRGIGGSMHLTDSDAGFIAATPIVGSSIPVAMGAAMANQMKKNDVITVIFIGDAALEEGVFHETINLAAVRKLPLIFFCENNLYSVYTPLKARQPNRNLGDLARGHSVPNFSVDGNEVIEVFSVGRHACELVRSGQGPVFIEAKTYRWREHCGVNYDNHLGYRTEQEFELWKERCPIERLKKSLQNESSLTEVLWENLRADIVKEVNAAVQFAKESPFLDQRTLMKFLYAE